jgi:hypothetical protein
MRKAKCAMCIVFVLLPVIAGLELASQCAPHAALPEQIAPYEAEILIYMLPEAQELRSQGMDVGWERETSPKLNQRDFYTFWVVNSKRPNVQGSVTVGHFSVNKHTAEVWDDNDKRVESSELTGIARILRQAHHIDEGTLHKYSLLRP